MRAGKYWMVVPLLGLVAGGACSRQLGDVSGVGDGTGEDGDDDDDDGDDDDDDDGDDGDDGDEADGGDDADDDDDDDGLTPMDIGDPVEPSGPFLERLDWDGQGFAETTIWEFDIESDSFFFDRIPQVVDFDGDSVPDVYLADERVLVWGPVMPGAPSTVVDALGGAEHRLVGDIDGRPGAELIGYGANSKLSVITFDQRLPALLDEAAKYAWHAAIAELGGQRGLAYLRQWPTPSLHFVPVVADQGFATAVELDLPPPPSGVDVRFVHGLAGSPDGASLWSVLTPSPFSGIPVDPAPSIAVTPLDGVTNPSEMTISLPDLGEDGVWDPRGVFLDVTPGGLEFVFVSGEGDDAMLTWVSATNQGVQFRETSNSEVARSVKYCAQLARAVDVDRDGFRDVVFPCVEGGGGFTVWWSTGAGGMSPLSTMQGFSFEPTSGVYPPGKVGVGDVDGDGIRDLVWARRRD